jgi:hypothetical protein
MFAIVPALLIRMEVFQGGQTRAASLFAARQRYRAGLRLGFSSGLASLATCFLTRRRISPTWPARRFSTCSLHTKRHGQSLFGHFSKRANCFRRSRTNVLSLINSASSCVASRGLPFIIMIDSSAYHSPAGGVCHLNQCIRPKRPNTEPNIRSALQSAKLPLQTRRGQTGVLGQ